MLKRIATTNVAPAYSRKREVLTEPAWPPAPGPERTLVTAVTSRLPKATVSNQKLMIVLFIEGAAWVKANSRPVVETSTSAVVRTMYGRVCQATLICAP